MWLRRNYSIRVRHVVCTVIRYITRTDSTMLMGHRFLEIDYTMKSNNGMNAEFGFACGATPGFEDARR